MGGALDGIRVLELARFQACGGTMVNPALANGMLYVSDGKAVTCWQLGE